MLGSKFATSSLLCVQDVVLWEALWPIRRRQGDRVGQLRGEIGSRLLTERGLRCPLQANSFHLLLLHVCVTRQTGECVSKTPRGRPQKPASESSVRPSQTCRTAEQETVPKEFSATHLKRPESSGKASVITRVHSSSTGSRMTAGFRTRCLSIEVIGV